MKFNIKSGPVSTTLLKISINSEPSPRSDEHSKGLTSTNLSNDRPSVSGKPSPRRIGTVTREKNFSQKYEDRNWKITTTDRKSDWNNGKDLKHSLWEGEKWPMTSLLREDRVCTKGTDIYRTTISIETYSHATGGPGTPSIVSTRARKLSKIPVTASCTAPESWLR